MYALQDGRKNEERGKYIPANIDNIPEKMKRIVNWIDGVEEGESEELVVSPN
tara:strand:- start:792 stop:947 length:156 start_codon:yes stop_codon:yes gene_type:complete